MSDWVRSYSQCGEDILLWRVLEGISGGFYIDVGAFDPNEDSVTRIFYDAGWSGINIEPNPGMLARFVEERPRDINLGIAASDRDAEMELNLIAETGLTTLVGDIAERHRNNGWQVEKTKVRTRPLADIWDAHVAAGQDVHFLKIDVEGAEEAVIRGADWSRHRPWIIVVEALEPHSTIESHRDWEPLLLEAGYQFVNFDGLNRYYVANERPQCIEPLRAPLNFITHKYVPAALHQAQDEVSRVNALVSDLQADLDSTRQELTDTHQALADTKQELAEKNQALAGTRRELAGIKQDFAIAKREQSALHDVFQRRPRPLWEKIVFRPSGKPKKLFRRILFHKSGRPRGVFRKWILLPDRRPRAVFHMWMSSPEYQNIRPAVHVPPVTNKTPVTLSPDAQQIARRVAAMRLPPSDRI